ncbi:MAG: lysine-sensitive aspartokinase 3 [Gemmatimonadota bacterium]|nr:lysine-sensitive aspartokinase 3 [Gemmatimonadota bacterium]
MIVVKFGGTSVGDAESIERAAAIVRTKLPHKPVVVVSALGGATNALLAIAEQATRGQLIGALRGVETLRERHLRETDTLLGEGDAADEVKAEISATIDELASLAEALFTLGHLTPRSLDAIASKGEEMSSTIIVAAFCQRGLPVEHVDARMVMITDDDFGRAAPRTDAIAKQARACIQPIVRAGRVPLLGGYIGATEQGITTTLGRGGSDYSAALLGAALSAKAIEIWTDVDGMLTADPRVVDGAQLIEEIRFDEAAELASFGAKVLHPSTIAPAVQRGIPVFIYNSRNPGGKGTRITASGPPRAVTAIAGKSGIAIIKVRSSRMLLAFGFLRTLFEVFERHKTSVDVVATSEVSVSLTVDDPSGLDSLLVDLRVLGDVSVERNRAIVAVVGASLGARSDTMGRALRALGEIPVHMLSLSATEINLTIILDEERLAPAMRALHAEFFGTPA